MSDKKKETLRDRVEAFCLTKCKSVRQFEIDCSLAQGSVSKLSDNTRRSTLERIKRVFSDFDIDYMLTGMEINCNNNPDAVNKFATEFFEERKRFEEIILKQQESIDKLINAVTQLTNFNQNKCGG